MIRGMVRPPSRPVLAVAVAALAVVALAPAAHAEIVPGREIAGVRLGMTEAQARAAVERFDPQTAARQETRIITVDGLRIVVGARAGRARVTRITLRAGLPEAETTREGVGLGTTLDGLLRALPDTRCGNASASDPQCLLAGRSGDTLFATKDEVVSAITVERRPERGAAACGSVGFGEPGEPSFGPTRIRATATTCAQARRVARASLPGVRYVRSGFDCRTVRDRAAARAGETAWRCTRPGSADRYAATITFRVGAP
jgi:hypothetical protein